MDRKLEIDLLSDNELDVVSGGMQAAFYYGEQVLLINSSPDSYGHYTQWAHNSGLGPHMGPA